MKFLPVLLCLLISLPALAQPGGRGYEGRGHADRGYGDRGRGEQGRYMQRDFGRPMPPPERRMTWEDRQRLREQVRSGDMTRDEARGQWREQRERRGFEPGRSPEERQRLRRDVQEANREFERR